MSRILLAWELGGNYGHLSRLLPLARALKERGHEVFVAARDVEVATEVLSREHIPFMQAPHVTGDRVSSRPITSYSDVMLAQGWGSLPALWGLVQAWGNLLQLYTPAALVIDYSPTALLAARVLRLPCAIIGTGFEIPPLESPLPPFPGFREATVGNADRAEAQAIETANRVLASYQAPQMAALRDLFYDHPRWLTTFPELDHYGPRTGESYIGPIGRLNHGQAVKWPSGASHRVLVYIRANTPGFLEIVRSLSALRDAAVVLSAPGVTRDTVREWLRPGFEFFPCPVALRELLSDASAFVSYAPAGSVAESLLAGVPQVLCPANVETQMTAFRVQCLGAGITLRGSDTHQNITASLCRVLEGRDLKVRALDFAKRHREVHTESAIEQIVSKIDTSLMNGRQNRVEG